MLLHRFFFLIILVLSILAILSSSNSITEETKNRTKRYSGFSLPDNTSCRVLFDFYVYVDKLNNTSTYVMTEIPFRFVLPNYDQLVSIYGKERQINDEGDEHHRLQMIEERRTEEHRDSIYQFVEKLFKRFGFDGTACLQRAICELGHSPLGSYGLLGKLIHLVLSPPLSNEKVAGPKNRQPSKKDVYAEAYRAGKTDGRCGKRYNAACSLSLFRSMDLF